MSHVAKFVPSGPKKEKICFTLIVSNGISFDKNHLSLTAEADFDFT